MGQVKKVNMIQATRLEAFAGVGQVEKENTIQAKRLAGSSGLNMIQSGGGLCQTGLGNPAERELRPLSGLTLLWIGSLP